MGIAADFCLIVIAGFLGALLARALRLPLLIGYVAAGVAVGPHTIGPTVSQIHDIELLAEIGVALLLFSLGLEVSLADLKPVWRVALIGGPIQVLLTGLAGGAAGMLLFGIPATEAAWLGAMISLSSTMVVLKNLAASGATSTLASRVMIGLLVLQDLAVVPMLIILPQLGEWQSAIGNVLKASGVAALFLGVAILLGSKWLPRMIAVIAHWGSRELFLVALVAIGVGVGFAAHAVGISFALGAFIAGVVLSESELSHQALSDIIPLRDVFGLLFFVSVGMLFDPAYVIRYPLQVFAMVAIVIISKAALTGGIARAFGYGNLAPWIVGLGLAQIGEFSFVLARSGRSLNILSKNTYDLALSCTILTIAVSPMLASIAPGVGRFVRSRWRGTKVLGTIALQSAHAKDHVVIGGAGRTGCTVAHMLQNAGIQVVLIEFDHNRYREGVSHGFNCVFGDVTRQEVLHAAGLHHARMLILTAPSTVTGRMALEQARRMRADLPVIARAADWIELEEWRAAQVGGDASTSHLDLVQPEFEGGLRMAELALKRVGIDPSHTGSLLRDAREGRLLSTS